MCGRDDHPPYDLKGTTTVTTNWTPAADRSICSSCGQPVTEELGEAQPYCLGCAPCDECGHQMRQHTSLHDMADPDWDTATCWASSICSECAPAVVNPDGTPTDATLAQLPSPAADALLMARHLLALDWAHAHSMPADVEAAVRRTVAASINERAAR